MGCKVDFTVRKYSAKVILNCHAITDAATKVAHNYHLVTRLNKLTVKSVHLCIIRNTRDMIMGLINCEI